MNNQEDQDVNRLLVWLAANTSDFHLEYGSDGKNPPWGVWWRTDSPRGHLTDSAYHSPREALKAAKEAVEAAKEQNT